MDLGGIVASALVTGILTTVLNQTFNWFRESRTAEAGRRLKASHLALRLAVILETFSLACADAIGDISMALDSGGTIGSFKGIPKLDGFPSEADAWSVLDIKLASDVLAFPLHLSLSRDAVSFEADVGDHETTAEEVSDQCAKLGGAADDIAARLRTRYQISPLVLPYDFRRTIRERLISIEARRKKHDERAS